MFSLPLLLVGIIAGLWGTVAMAQSNTVYVAPAFTYQSGPYVPHYYPTVPQAFADAQAQVAALSNTNWTYAALNWRADNFPSDAPYWYYDSTPTLWIYDLYSCYLPTGQCSTATAWGTLTTNYVCPDGSDGGRYLNSPSQNELIACAIPTFYVQPPPKICLSCLGNPIYASTGQKMQAETDYSGLPGMDFTRTYWSSNGFFSSVLKQTFVNNSSPAGTMTAACYPAHYTSGYGTGSYCAPYISTFGYVSGGAPQYQLQSADGRSTLFTGPNSAVTAAADINDQVTQVTIGGAAGWQIQREDDSIELYNGAGALVQRTLRGGRVLTYTYSTSSTSTSIAPWAGLLISQSDAFGHTLSWIYNAAAQMIQMTDPAGGTYQYSYDGSGNLTGVVYPDSSSKTYWYNESANTGGASMPNALTGITDESTTRFATYQYQSSPYFPSSYLAVNSQHAGGVDSYTFSYTVGGSPARMNSTQVTDPLGTVRTYNFQHNLSYNDDSSQTQPAASGSGTVTKSETYDANGNPASVTDFNGNVTTYVYDLTRNLETSRTEAYGTAQARTITTTWDASWRQPDLITEPNRTTAFSYDSLGNVLTKTVTDTTAAPNVARTWTYTYDSYGRMLTADGPRTDVSDVTTYAYYTCTTGYQCGQIHTMTDALGHVTTFNTYNGHGQPLTITDPNGVVTTLTYDARQRVTSRQIGTETTSYTYYPTGLLNLVTLPDSSTIQYTYDGAHRLTDITDGLGNHTHYTLDNAGNRTAENTYDPSNVLRRTHSRVINALNQLYQDVNAAGTSAVTTTLAYDDNANLTSSNAPLSRNTVNQYDALNRLSQITDPNSGVTVLGYDANDNLASVKDPRNLTTSYSHNGFGDVTQLASPDTGTSSSTYDSGGNLNTTTDARSAVATYAYDALNRVTQVAYSDQTINFTYDTGTNGVGRLTGASDANHSLSWTYDALGRVTGKGQTVGTITKSVGYGYTNGDLISLVTPSGQTVTYGYTNHQVTSVAVNGTTIAGAVTYFPFGPVSGWTWGNSTTVSRSYDTDAKITQISTAADTINFGYDNAFRITGITDTGNGANSWTLGYDSLDRLTSAAETGTTLGWTYDANGNRLSQTGSGASTFTPSSTSNQLNSMSGTLARTYSFDAAGNTTGYASDSFALNQRGRVSVATISGSAANYIYNALGQMVKKSGNGGTTLLMYDEAGHVLGEYSSAGALIEETVWMGDVPIATLQPNGSGINIYYVHTDQLNAPRVITRPSDNAVAWRWDTDPFGTVAPNQNPASLGTFIYNLRFPGQYYLPESGLNLNYFRDYDPQTGRYLESDPIGQLFYFGFSTSQLRLARGLKFGYWNHLYNYTDNSPISGMDRTGLGLLDLIKELLGDKAHEHITATQAAGLLATLCIAQQCEQGHKNIDSVFAEGVCISILSELSKQKGGPEWVGTANAYLGMGAMAGECGTLCSEGVKKCTNCGAR